MGPQVDLREPSLGAVAYRYHLAPVSSRSSIGLERAPPLGSDILSLSRLVSLSRHRSLAVVFQPQTAWQMVGWNELFAAQLVLGHLLLYLSFHVGR